MRNVLGTSLHKPSETFYLIRSEDPRGRLKDRRHFTPVKYTYEVNISRPYQIMFSVTYHRIPVEMKVGYLLNLNLCNDLDLTNTSRFFWYDCYDRGCKEGHTMSPHVLIFKRCIYKVIFIIWVMFIKSLVY